MANNLEIKARCRNLKEAEDIVKNLATKFLGIDFQTDTYFSTKSGRFKLRESTLSGAYLIPYLRKDQTDAKISLYDKIPIADSNHVKNLFTQILGLFCIVKKKRMIYLYHNVRIHLDDVENLGQFIEFEAVFDSKNSDKYTEKQKIEFLKNKLKINQDELIAESYQNLILKRNQNKA